MRECQRSTAYAGLVTNSERPEEQEAYSWTPSRQSDVQQVELRMLSVPMVRYSVKHYNLQKPVILVGQQDHQVALRDVPSGMLISGKAASAPQ